MKLFLTSSVSEVAHDIVKHLDLSKGNKLVFIDTAAETERNDDITWLINDRDSLIKAGFEVVDYSITGKNLEEIKSFLAEFDYIYMSGGNTLHLLTESYKSGLINLIKDLVKDKVYIGTSAGSIITGPSVPEYLRDPEKQTEFEKEPAYNLVNFTTAPHWGSIHFKDEYLGRRLKIAYVDTNQPYILLNDRQYVLVEDNQFKIIDLNR